MIFNREKSREPIGTIRELALGFIDFSSYFEPMGDLLLGPTGGPIRVPVEETLRKKPSETIRKKRSETSRDH